jgi:hypothetical protein
MRAPIAALLLALAAAPAGAASFDCARAGTPVERAVCADPESSALDEKQAALWGRVVAATPPWLAQTRAAQRDWAREARGRELTDAERIRRAYRLRIAALEAELALLADPRLAALPEAEAGRTCLPLPPPGALPSAADRDRPCQVTESGPLGRPGAAPLRFATYEYPGGSATIRQVALVVLAPAVQPGRLRVQLALRAEDQNCGTPALLRAERGPLLLWSCSLPGTGMFNAESLFAWRDEGWRELDITSWLAELERRLPRDLGAWKGIFPDYVALTAVTPLWRGEDGNCCPTGGRADLRLGWQGDRLVLREVQVTRGPAAARR